MNKFQSVVDQTICQTKERSSAMKKHSLIITVLLIVSLFGMATPAAASTPADVTIVAIMQPQSEDPIAPYAGTFEASGPAVDAGILCANGVVEDIANPAVGWQSDQVINLYVHKHFVCNDGSGTFEMDMHVLIAPKGVTARWIITAGDGLYARLFGSGRLTATWLSENMLEDMYFGNLHIE